MKTFIVVYLVVWCLIMSYGSIKGVQAHTYAVCVNTAWHTVNDNPAGVMQQVLTCGGNL